MISIIPLCFQSHIFCLMHMDNFSKLRDIESETKHIIGVGGSDKIGEG